MIKWTSKDVIAAVQSAMQEAEAQPSDPTQIMTELLQMAQLQSAFQGRPD
jgi:hypothetical protein